MVPLSRGCAEARQGAGEYLADGCVAHRPRQSINDV